VDARMVALVAVDTTVWVVDKPYDYLIPAAMQSVLRPGMRVLVPFGRGNRKTEGIVLGIRQNSTQQKLKSIEEVLDESPVLDEHRLKLAMYLRERLFCTCYALIRAMLPAGFWFRLEPEYRLHAERRAEALDALGDREEAPALVEALAGGGRTLTELRPFAAKESLEEALRILSEKGLVEKGSRASPAAGEKTAKLYSLAPGLAESLEGDARILRSKEQREVGLFLLQAGSANAHDICYYTGVSASVISNMVKRELLLSQEVEVLRRPSVPVNTYQLEFTLNEGQQRVYEGLRALLDEKKAAAALLFGVTGSGKTQV